VLYHGLSNAIKVVQLYLVLNVHVLFR